MKYVNSKIKTSAFLKNYQTQKEKINVQKQITREDIEQFKKDPTKNPKTGRPISSQGKIYKEYESLIEKENIQPKVIVKRLKAREPAKSEKTSERTQI